MKKIWDWINGKKTLIGGTILLISLGVHDIAALWFDQIPESINALVGSLNYIGASLSSGGWLHKLVKVSQEKTN